jgi:hypothetical protein
MQTSKNYIMFAGFVAFTTSALVTATDHEKRQRLFPMSCQTTIDLGKRDTELLIENT